MEEPDDHSHTHGLNSPFEFNSPSAYVAPPSRDSYLDEAVDSNPDDFYRPFAADRPSRPDIVVNRDNDEDTMSGAKRKAPHLNGSTPKASASPVSAAGRSSALRSASGPATPQSPLNAAKSSPSLSTPVKSQSGSIKDRIKQFEQARGDSPGRGTARGGRARAASASKLTSSSASSLASESRSTPRGGHTASRQRGSKSSLTREPLFGEVMSPEATEDDPGYGISSVTSPHTDKMQGSMHHPNPMFGRGRSQSVSEASGDLDANQDESPVDPSYSLSPSDDAPHVLSPTRIPAPVKGCRASDLGPLNGAVTPPAAAGADISSRTLSPNRATTPQQKARLSATTPPGTLSSRRYSPHKATEPNQTLNAVVKAPLPKYSPPLRSSRPRQPVSIATTSASRAKVSERYKGTGSSGSGSDSTPANARRANPKAIPGVDVAARRAKLQNKFEAERAKELKQEPDKPNVLKKKAKEGISEEGDEALPVLAPTTYSPQREVPELSLNTADTFPSGSEPPSSTTDTPHTDIEESPIIPGSYPSADSPIIPGSYPSSDSPVAPNGNFMQQVMELRERSTDTTPRTQAVSDFLSEKDETETIGVVLAPTPRLENWRDPNTPSEALSPIPDRDEPEETFHDDRSTILPDDSISMVGGHIYQPHNEPVPPLPASVEESRPEHLLDDEGRRQIASILDQYRNRPILVTQQRSYQFKRLVEERYPELPLHDSWGNLPATVNYLQFVLDLTQPSTADWNPEHLVSPLSEHTSPENEEPTGFATIFPSAPYSRDSVSSMGSSIAQHSHTASNSTLRPSRSIEEHCVTPVARNRGDSKPLPLPREGSRNSAQYFTGSGPYQDGSDLPQIPQIPESSLSGNGLGLRVGQNSPLTPASPHPPAPNHAPPPPPAATFDSAGSSNWFQSPFSPAFYTQDSFSTGYLGASHPAPTRAGALVDNGTGNVPTSTKTSGELSRPGESRSASLDAGQGPPDSAPNGASAPTTPLEQNSLLSGRLHVIKEIVNTENSFARDMALLENLFLGTSGQVLSNTDRKTLFGNVDEICAFSTEFLDDLKRAAETVYVIPQENRWHAKLGFRTPSSSTSTETTSMRTAPSVSDEDFELLDQKTTIGKAFLQRLPKMEDIYAEYIKAYESATHRIKEIERTPLVHSWLEECFASAKEYTMAWDLDSFLSKPMQRMTKYPLLLDALIKRTQPDHPDYAALKMAFEGTTNVCIRIDDARKRAKLVDQAMGRKRKEQDSRIKLGKFVNRRAERMRIGFMSAADDQSYEAIAQKFGGHFFQLQIVMRDIEKYLEDLQENIGWLTSFTRSLIQYCQADTESRERYPEYESNWIRFGQAMNEVFDVALADHTNKVRKLVIDPILALWKLHEGPQKMMAKRKKRLADHQRFKAVTQRNDKPDKRLQMDEDQFQAVNETLKEELPKLYALTKQLVEACLKNFIQLQAEWMSTWKRKTQPFVGNDDWVIQDIGLYVSMIQSTFSQDSAEWQMRVTSLAICNGSALAEAQNFLSPSSTWNSTQQDGSSYKRPSTMGSSRRALSIDSEAAQQHHTPASSYRISGNMGFSPSPLLGSFPLPDGLSQSSTTVRTRASSAMSSRGPSTPHSFSAQYVVPAAFNPPRPSTSSEMRRENAARPPVDYATAQELEYETNFILDQENEGRFHDSPEERFSGIFQSALPMSDSPRSSSPQVTEDGEARVLFLAASLFEFNIDGSRREAGYPYLRYVPGEVSDDFCYFPYPIHF